MHRAALAPSDLARLRAVWWRLWRHGVRLPAERGVIVIDARRDEVEEQKEQAWDLWLDCLNYRDIAKAMGDSGPDEDTIGRWK